MCLSRRPPRCEGPGGRRGPRCAATPAAGPGRPLIAPLRVFVAVTLPPGLRQRLEDVAAPLRAIARGVSWVSATNYHLTLKFLGAVDEARVPAIAATLAVAVERRPPFEVAVSGLGAFPTATRARVIWAGVSDGDAALAALAAAVDGCLSAHGFPAEARGFSGHVTLGRVREPRRDPALAAALARAARVDFGSARVDHVVLMQSRLSPMGAQYAELASLPLAGRS